MRNQRFILVMTLVLGLCFEVAPIANVCAQGVDEEIFFFKLPVVTATMDERSLGSAPSQIYSWGSEDIWRYGIMDICDLLANTPGWFVSTPYLASHPTYCVRGYHAPHTGQPQSFILFMEDFLRLNETSYYGHFYAESLRNLDQFERIEVINGPGGAMYGDNAVAGVVNAISKKVDSNGKNTWTSQTSYESNWNRWRSSLAYSGKLTKNIQASIMLHQTYADTTYEHGINALSNKELRCIERTPFIHEDSIPWSNTGNKYDLPEYDISMDIYNDLNLRMINNAIARQGSIVAWNWTDDTNQSSPWRVFGRKMTVLSYDPASLRDTLSPVLSVSTGKFYDQRVSAYCPQGTITGTTTIPAGTNWKARNEDSLAIDFQCKPYYDKDNTLLCKMGYAKAEYDELYLRKAQNGSLSKYETGTYELTRYGVLAQWENFSIDNIILTTGLRFDHNRAGSKKITDNNLPDSISLLSPRIAINWTPTGMDSMRFIYAKSGRQVPASEIGKAADDWNWTKKDVTEDIEVNYSRQLSKNSLIAGNIFYMNSPSTYVLADTLKKRVGMKSKGIEILYKHDHLLNKGSLESSVTYWHPEIKELEDKGMSDFPDIPSYLLKLKWSGQLLPDRLNYSLLYQGNFDINSYQFNRSLTVQSQKTSNVNLVDIILSTPLNQNGSIYRLGVKNLFDCQEKEPGSGYNSGGDDTYNLKDSRVQNIGRSLFVEIGNRF
ncbi:TonB-dependent receptor [Candidatus Desantisbacteria bacterium]|nr:TonB-dependent receptor [Candidatus Desantisbacteria bacterium]